jgi:hypothetical protein
MIASAFAREVDGVHRRWRVRLHVTSMDAEAYAHPAVMHAVAL